MIVYAYRYTKIVFPATLKVRTWTIIKKSIIVHIYCSRFWLSKLDYCFRIIWTTAVKTGAWCYVSLRAWMPWTIRSMSMDWKLQCSMQMGAAICELLPIPSYSPPPSTPLFSDVVAMFRAAVGHMITPCSRSNLLVTGYLLQSLVDFPFGLPWMGLKWTLRVIIM